MADTEDQDPIEVAVLETLGIDKLTLAPGEATVQITTQRGTVISIPRRTEPAT